LVAFNLYEIQLLKTDYLFSVLPECLSWYVVHTQRI
jgi:hypothetical protein